MYITDKANIFNTDGQFWYTIKSHLCTHKIAMPNKNSLEAIKKGAAK